MAPPSCCNSPDLHGFNQPFKNLRRQLKLHNFPLEQKPTPPPCPVAPDDAALFWAAMQEVAPLARDGAYSVPPPVPAANPPPISQPADLEALYQLLDLVEGRGEFDLSLTDEYLAGQVPGLDQRIVAALQAGQLPVQDHCDLHGLTVSQARERLAAFISQARKKNFRTVLVIHGRGRNSPRQIPVLKQHLQQWLTMKSFRRQVLAFASARSYDGGTGALYLLLAPPCHRLGNQTPRKCRR